jgi:hypothetical protein
MHDWSRKLNKHLRTALELIDKEVSLLSNAPVTVQRQSVLVSYHQVLKYWQVEVEVEPTSSSDWTEFQSNRELWNQIYRKLSRLGSESILVSKPEEDRR